MPNKTIKIATTFEGWEGDESIWKAVVTEDAKPAKTFKFAAHNGAGVASHLARELGYVIVGNAEVAEDRETYTWTAHLVPTADQVIAAWSG